VQQGEREVIPEDCPVRLASVIKVCWDGDSSLRPEAVDVAEFLRSQDTDLSAFLSRRRITPVSEQSGFGYAPNLDSEAEREPVSRGSRRSRDMPLLSDPNEEEFKSSSGLGEPAAPPSAPSGTKPLEQLTDVELERWLTSIGLSPLIPKLKGHGASGEVLSLCETVEEITEFGCLTAVAKLLLKKIQEATASGGVPLSRISDPTALDYAPTASSTTTSSPASAPASTATGKSPSLYIMPLRSLLCSVPMAAPPPGSPAEAIPPIARPSDEDFIKYILEGKTELVAEALRHYPDLIIVQDRNEDTCLTWASRYGHTDIVELLLDSGADVHHENIVRHRVKCILVRSIPYPFL